MENILRAVQRDVNKFKSKYISKEAIKDKLPDMVKVYTLALDEYLKSPQFMKAIQKAATQRVGMAVSRVIESRKFQDVLTKVVLAQLKKGIDLHGD